MSPSPVLDKASFGHDCFRGRYNFSDRAARTAFAAGISRERKRTDNGEVVYLDQS
jgi:hypothetical protein